MLKPAIAMLRSLVGSEMCIRDRDRMEDMSGIDPAEDDWLSYEVAQEDLADIFQEVGKVYLPALLANAKAIAAEEKTWTTQIDGAQWEQRTFPYQAKCLQWINDEFNALNDGDQNQIMAFLKKTGCEDLIIK